MPDKLPPRILGKPIDEIDDDKLGVFEPTEAAVAVARKLLRRVGVYELTAKQIADARESARLELRA